MSLEMGIKKFGLKELTERYKNFLMWDGLQLPLTYINKNKTVKGIVDGALFDNHRDIMIYNNPTRFSLFLRAVWSSWTSLENFLIEDKPIPQSLLNEINFRTSGNILRSNLHLNRKELTQINFFLFSDY